MSTVQHPPGAIGAAPPVAPPDVDFSNSELVKRWAAVLREQIDDAIAAGLDATEPLGRRLLGRRAARRHLVDAAECIERMFATAGLSDVESQPESYLRKRVREASASGAASGERAMPAELAKFPRY